MTKNTTKTAVLNASKKWIESFNMGDIKYCSEQYLEQTVMDARPMGRFTGRAEIYDFWRSRRKLFRV